MSSTKIHVEAVTRQRYNGIWYVPGETFEVESQAEFDDMVASRPPLVKLAKVKYETRTMVPEATQDNSPATQQPKSAAPVQVSTSQKNGKYDRRDMRAR